MKIILHNIKKGSGLLFIAAAFLLSGNFSSTFAQGIDNIDLSSQSISENAGADAVVGTLTTQENGQPSAGPFVYAFVDGANDNTSFNLNDNGGTWELRANASFDYETPPGTYTVEISSDYAVPGANAKIDGVNALYSEQFTITVTNVWEAPTDITLTDQSIPENSGVNGVVGVLTTTDPDQQTHTYSLVSGDGSTNNGSFNVFNNGGTWQLRAAANLNYETDTRTYSVRVRTTEVAGDGLFFEESFEVTLTDVNDIPQDIVLSNDDLDENEPATTYVGQFVTVDEDPSNTVFIYSLVSGEGDTDNGLFYIVGNSLLEVGPLDHEASATRSIRVQTNDGNGGTRVEQFTINIVDINEAPTGPALNGSSVAENSASGTTVGTFSPVDQDAGGSYTYALVNVQGAKTSVTNDNAGNGYSLFTIEGSTLKTASVFNYEGTYQSYNINVRVTDNGGLTSTQTFNISIGDVNETPTDIGLNDAIIAENAGVNGVVGALSTTDPDNGQSHIYSLVEGTDDDDNALFDISGSNLVAKNSLNFEGRTPATYKVRVRTTDSNEVGPNLKINQTNTFDVKTYDKAFVVTVTDVNDTPSAVLLSANHISENSSTGLTIGTLSSTDDESAAQSYTYTIEDPTSPKLNVVNTPVYVDPNFEIVGSALKNKVAFNYENRSSYTIYVRTTDNGSPNKYYVQQLTIYVDNVNEKPALAIGENAVTYTEAGQGTQLVAQATITDLDEINTSGKLSVTNNQGLYISKATVQITGNYDAGNDTLRYSPQVGASSKISTVDNGLSTTWDDQTGLLTLTGEATLASYESSLESVYFSNSSTSPNPLARTVTFIVTDVPVSQPGGADLNKSDSFSAVNDEVGLSSDAVTRTVNITLVNNAPILSAVEEAGLSYSEGDGQVQISNTIVVADDNSYTTIAGATVTIGNGYVEGQDFLRYPTTNSVTGVFTGATGVLALSGSRSFADYQAALRAVKFENTSQNPTAGNRTITFVVDDPGVVDKPNLNAVNIESQGISRTVTVSGVNDAPTLSAMQAGQLDYWENSGTQQITNTITIADVDDGNIFGATIQITGNPQVGADVLSLVVPVTDPKLSGVNDDYQINASWNAPTAMLTLSGEASVGTYQSYLTYVKYENTSDNPTTAVRTVTFKVNDRSAEPTSAQGNLKQGGSTIFLESAGLSRQIVMHASDDIAVFSEIEETTIAFIEDADPMQITNTIVVSDVDSDNLNYASIEISDNYISTEDVLSFVDQNGITGEWFVNDGVLILSGTASKLTYQAALRSVKYQNTSQSPDANDRTISFYPYDYWDDNANASLKDSQDRTSFIRNYESRVISIVNTNDDPYVEINTGFGVDIGGNAVITEEQLLALDPDVNDYLIYTILQAPLYGVLKNAETEIFLDGTFSQNDIMNGNISYTHDGGTSTSDAFLFEVADNSNATSQFEAVAITILSANSVPMPPTNITIAVNENGKPVLSWTNGAGVVQGIEVWRQQVTTAKNSGVFEFVLIATLPPGVKSYVDVTAEEGVSYQYQVTAFNSNGSSGVAPGTGGEVTQTAQLSTPSSLDAIVNNNGSISLSWNDNSNLEDGYKIERQSNISSNWTEIATVNSGVTHYSDASVLAGVTYSYRVKAYSATLVSGYSNIADVTTLVTGIEDFAGTTPVSYELNQNYPNPFNPSTTIRFGLPGESNVTIVIYNILGSEVATLVNNVMSAGYHEVRFDASNFTSGIYIYKIQAGDFVQIKKMILMK